MFWMLLSLGAVAVIIAFLLIRNWTTTRQWMLKAYTRSVQVSAQSATKREIEQKHSEVIQAARKADQQSWESVQNISDDTLLDELRKSVVRK